MIRLPGLGGSGRMAESSPIPGIDAKRIPVDKERVLKSAADFGRGVAGSVSSGSKKALDAAASGSKRAMESAASGSRKALDSTTAVSREVLKSAADFSRGVAGSVSSGSKKALGAAASGSKRAMESAASGSRKALDSTTAVSREALQSATDFSSGVAGSVSSGSKKALGAAASGSKRAMESAASGSRRALDSTTAVSREAWKSASVSAAGLVSVTHGVLASTLSADLNSMLAGLAKGPVTIYDKALDAGYLATNIGGGNHRLFDGGHTIAGAFKAVQGASTEDGLIQEGFGFVQSMFRDLTTSKGLPLANWDKATYDHAASFLETRFQLSREWFYDLNSYTAAELVGGSIGILAVVFQWNRADTESFSRMVGGMGVAAVLSANPLLLVITVVAVARAFQRARTEGNRGHLVDGSVRGSAVATLTIVAVAQVTTIGGPVGLSFLVGIVVGILANKAVSHVSVVDISRVLAERAKAAAVEFGSLRGLTLPAPPAR